MSVRVSRSAYRKVQFIANLLSRMFAIICAGKCLLHTFWCKISFKKTLSSAQNIENKGSEFFLPSRSMVLKVVTGKIFKTLGLSWSFDIRLPDGGRGAFSILGPRQSRAQGQVVKDRRLSYR